MTQVNTRAAHQAAVARMGGLSQQLDDVQGQIARGLRIETPADDPIAFARAALLRREQAAAAATQRGIDAATRRLTATDTSIESLDGVVQRGRELALQANNATLSPADRQTIAAELRELEAQARTLADARDSDGQRLFGGAVSDRPAYAVDADGVTVWQGGGVAPSVTFGAGQIAGGSDGPSIFGTTDAATDTRDLFATFAALRTALAEADPELRGAAVTRGIADLDSHVSRLADARGLLGARLARLESETTRIDKASLATETDLSKLESLDMPAAIARLQRLLTVLEAAQASFTRITNLSLWDQLR